MEQLSDNFIARYILGRLTLNELIILNEWVKLHGKKELKKREREVLKKCMEGYDFSK